jgi:hypothetical protein
MLSLLVAVSGLTALAGAAGAAGAARERRWAAVDVAGDAGIATARTRTWSAAPHDADGDGDQDLLIGYHPVEKLWSNDGDGTYTRVAADAWPAGAIDRHTCDWADVDQDGLPDVYCATGRGLRNRVKEPSFDNELWLQRSPGVFEDVGTAWGVGDTCGRGRAVSFVDANGDRFPDLFVGNHSPRPVPDPCDDMAPYPNERSKLFVNVRGTRFRYAPRMWHDGAGPGTRCALPFDFDRDGWQDLFLCRAVGERPRLYRNLRGNGFRDVTPRQGFGHDVADAVVGDLVGSSAPDLVTASRAGFGIHRNRHGGFAGETRLWTVAHGEGMGVAVGDAEGDGDLDVYAMVGNGTQGNPDDAVLQDRGTRFVPVRVPSAGGAADDVVTVRRLAAGPDEFLALNGYNLDGRGPVQLVRLVRTASPPVSPRRR